MGLFKRSKRIVDERIENVKKGIFKEAFIAAMAISILSMIIKFSLYGIKVELVAAELAILIIPGLYFVIRSVIMGIYSDEIEIHDRISKMSANSKNVIIALIFGFALAAFFGIRSAVLYGNDFNRLWYFFLVFTASLIIYCPFLVVYIVITHNIAKKVSSKVSQKNHD